MTKHKTEDYKISAVKYYLNNDRGDGYVSFHFMQKSAVLKLQGCKIFFIKNRYVEKIYF